MFCVRSTSTAALSTSTITKLGLRLITRNGSQGIRTRSRTPIRTRWVHNAGASGSPRTVCDVRRGEVMFCVRSTSTAALSTSTITKLDLRQRTRSGSQGIRTRSRTPTRTRCSSGRGCQRFTSSGVRCPSWRCHVLREEYEYRCAEYEYDYEARFEAENPKG